MQVLHKNNGALTPYPSLAVPPTTEDGGRSGDIQEDEPETPIPAYSAPSDDSVLGATDDPTGRKPTTVTVLGRPHSVKSWKDVLTTVCNALAQQHGDTFAEQAATIKGRKRHYFVATDEDLISPVQIEGTDLWVETNLSAKAIMKLTGRLLQRLGHDSTDMVINCRPQA